MPAHNFQNAQLWSCQSTKYFHTVLRIIKMFSCKTETSLHVFILKLCPSALNALFLIVEPCLLNGASQACSSLLSNLLFVSSHLLTNENLLLLWTGLNDQQVTSHSFGKHAFLL
uniref:Uncharacterized protein n=1 Tax=Oryzias latipes TaxID=8090 RepID=A0A3B3HYK9_ORYLA